MANESKTCAACRYFGVRALRPINGHVDIDEARRQLNADGVRLIGECMFAPPSAEKGNAKVSEARPACCAFQTREAR